MELRVAHTLPDGLTDLSACALADALGGPTLFDLRQRDEAPIFVSVLVHGNEISGWEAVRRLRDPLRTASALLFVGNVEAARAGVRALPGRPDFNRVWDGGGSAEAVVAAQVAEYAAAAKPRLAIDIHNNTGRNPPYAVIARADADTLTLARAFAKRALLATQPQGFQTGRFAQFCTAITVEVGTPTEPAAIDRSTTFLRRLLARPPVADATSLRLYETVARVTLSEDAEIVPQAQRFNFRTAPAGAVLAARGVLTAQGADGRDLGDVYFSRANGATVLKQDSIIGMYTGSLHAAQQDCLCYFLEPATVANS